LLGHVDALARELGTPDAEALAATAAGVVAHLHGRFDDSIAACERAVHCASHRGCSGTAARLL
jgi:hypothetical protein